MNSGYLRYLLASACCVMASAVAYGQEASGTAHERERTASAGVETSGDEATLASGEIVVTAQRRAERLQDVPIAISALSNENMVRRGLTDLSNLRGAVPGLTVSTFAAFNASNLISIRGISGQPLPIGASQATALYLDGVFLSRPDAAFFSLDDVERVEVLRGPQGTLYGRNATAGAINIITRTPDDRLTGGIQASYGNFDAVMIRGSLSGPLGGGVSASLSGSYDARDGYFTNSITGNRIGERHQYSARAKLRYSNDAGFDATLSGDYTRGRGHEHWKALYANGTNGGPLVGLGNPKVLATDIENLVFANRASGGVSLSMNVELNSLVDLTSITSFREVTAATIYDSGGDALNNFVSFGDNYSRAFNQEVRAVYTGDTLRITGGANYYHERGRFIQQVGTAPPARAATPRDSTDLEAIAAFGQVEIDLTPQLTLVGGLRLNYETRNFLIDYTNAFPTRGGSQAGKVSDTAVIPMGGINYKPGRDVLVYAKISKGYQAPGFNFSPGVAALPGNFSFGPETLLAYEAGVKSQFFDRRVTLNAAAFWYDSQGVQIRSPSLPVGTTIVSNAASATTKGFEVELTVAPAEGLTLSGQATYLDATFGSFCELVTPPNPRANNSLCTPTTAQRGGNRLLQAPRWSGGASANYTQPLADGSAINANLAYSFESNVFFTTANLEGASNGGWHRLDARLGYQILNGPEIYVYGRNLTDDRYAGFIIRINNGSSASISEPRTYGIGARYRF